MIAGCTPPRLSEGVTCPKKLHVDNYPVSATNTLRNERDTARAAEIWADYQREHDVSKQIGQAVGIDPVSGRVWFGASAKDIVQRLDAEGIFVPLFFLRVGQDFYSRKGGRR